MPTQIQSFLEKNTEQVSIDKIKIIEWRPCVNYYKDAYLNIFSQAAGFLKRTDAERRTEAAFGRRWVKNFFKNIANIKKNVLYRQSGNPVIIIGSGPGLENAIPEIYKAQDYFIIIAASSSVTALSHAGIKADIVISTDGGPWALRHLYPGIRDNYLKNIGALAVNLCACLPSQCGFLPHLIINDASSWQSIALHELSIPSVVIAQKGTVTASAVELAMILSRGNIYLSGMDFSVDDIRTHIKPYGFDFLFFERACRFLPAYSQIFTRSSLLDKGGSMNIYGAWFKNQLELWPKKIFSIGKSKVFTEGDLKKEPFKNKKTENKFLAAACVKENSRDFKKRALNAIITGLKNPLYSQSIKKELGSLLFAGRKTFSESELEAALKETALGGTSYE